MKRRLVTAKQGSSRFRFFGETIGELKKVTWLTRREIIYLTTLVLIMAAIAGLVLGVLDFGFTRLIDVILG
jgi:preprotein translocase subunit SecE